MLSETKKINGFSVIIFSDPCCPICQVYLEEVSDVIDDYDITVHDLTDDAVFFYKKRIIPEEGIPCTAIIDSNNQLVSYSKKYMDCESLIEFITTETQKAC